MALGVPPLAGPRAAPRVHGAAMARGAHQGAAFPVWRRCFVPVAHLLLGEAAASRPSDGFRPHLYHRGRRKAYHGPAHQLSSRTPPLQNLCEVKFYELNNVTMTLPPTSIFDLFFNLSFQAIAFMKKITANDESVYPEGLRHMFVINAPRVVTMGWKMISPWLDPRVREKIHIWGPDFLPHLRGYIAPEQLPAELGGTSPHPIAWLRGVPGQDDALVGGRR
eukprot:RCo028814